MAEGQKLVEMCLGEKIIAAQDRSLPQDMSWLSQDAKALEGEAVPEGSHRGS